MWIPRWSTSGPSADHPLVSNGQTSKLRMVAPGLGHGRAVRPASSTTWPRTARARRRTSTRRSPSPSTCCPGELTVYHAGSWDPFGPGDYALVHEGGAHGFRNDGDEWASFLILFAPGIARENFFLEMAELRRSGRTLTPEEMTAFYARHDQVMVDA